MSLNSILSAEAVENAVKEFQAPESFSFKKFFQLCGLSSKSPKEVKDVFLILDSDNSGYIEEAELKFFLQRFVPGARTLTDAECKGFMSAADDDNDGRIGVEEGGPNTYYSNAYDQSKNGFRNARETVHPITTQFFIYNPSFGPREGEEEKKILFYHPSEVEKNEKIRNVGLCSHCTVTRTFLSNKAC
ncbi:hypothetical protein DPEC_G00134500 [Dallia pectoralis]|uniref:Uncharacterized protein n=1 Tax=Dallia pectoralis TaxID=75939 RepID=A0ACC2GSG3_DALPE|nr:hypothetical protein DPEC_G00134500 [Dallia pectoralis]